MGKGKRNRAERSLKKASNPAVNEKKDRTSLITAIVVAVVVVIIVCSFVLTALLSNGTFERKNIAVTSENFEFNQLMMSYMFNSAYTNFYETYYQYIAYGLIKLDPQKSLSSQTYETGEDGSVTTWYDYFMASTVSQCEDILVYCEKAKEAGIKLDESDKKKIDRFISEIKEDIQAQADQSGYNEGYIRQSLYGQGVSYGDIEDCLELMYLSSKYQGIVSDDLGLKIDDDRINEYFLENYGDFIRASYTTLTLSAKLETVKTSDFAETDKNGKTETDSSGNIVYDREAYESAVESAKEAFNAEKAELDAVKEGLSGLYTNNKYITEYVKSITDKTEFAETNAEGDAETDTNGSVIYDEEAYESAVAKAVEEFDAKNKEYIEWAIEEYVYDYLVESRIDEYNEKYYESLSAKKETETNGELTDKAKAEVESAIDEYIRQDAKPTVNENYAYNTNTGLGVWVFGGSDTVVKETESYTVSLNGAANAFDMIFATDLPEAETETESETGTGSSTESESQTETESATETESSTETETEETSYAITLYVVTEAAARSEDDTKNIGYILLEKETETSKDGVSQAQKDAVEIYNKVIADENMNEDKFEELGFEYDAAYYAIVDNYTRGGLGFDLFDKWVFDFNGEEHKKGDCNWLDLSEYIAVVYYIGDGMTAWQAEVFNAVLTEDNQTWLEEASKGVKITVNNDICYNIKG